MTKQNLGKNIKYSPKGEKFLNDKFIRNNLQKIQCVRNVKKFVTDL